MQGEWMWCQLLGKLITWHVARLNPANPIIYHLFLGPTVAIVTPSVATATQGGDSKGEALYCRWEEGLAEKDGDWCKMKVCSFLMLRLYTISNKSGDPVMCSTGLHTDKKVDGRRGVVDTHRLKQKRDQAALPVKHHWMALCPYGMSHRATMGAFSRVSNNKGEKILCSSDFFFSEKTTTSLAVIISAARGTTEFKLRCKTLVTASLSALQDKLHSQELCDWKSRQVSESLGCCLDCFGHFSGSLTYQ